jgi:tetratricopeptide (TPR) repeat protein
MAATSASEGKLWLGKVLSKINSENKIENVLDIGVGEGTYSTLYRNSFGSKWTGVEIHEPYIEQHDLKRKYHELLIGDAREVPNESTEKYSVAFCGDVLEHMTKDDAMKLHASLLDMCDYVVVSVPIIDFPQDEEEGNPYQAHLATWDHVQALSSFGWIRTWYKGSVVGVYVSSKNHEIDIPTHTWPKIAVYTVAKNEEQFVDRMIKSALEADVILIADTGSTDKTYDFVKDWSETNEKVIAHKISISPWRFDMARNAALALLPDDIDLCLSVDMDEMLAPGWRQLVDEQYKYWHTRMFFKFIWSFKPDGSPDVQFWGDKAHARHGYRWVHPVHEVIEPYGIQEHIVHVPYELHHRQDQSKPRSQYLSLLRQSCIETPTYGKNSLYLGREYFFYNQYRSSIAELTRYLSLAEATWAPDRASAHKYSARCHEALGELDEAENRYIEATKLSPEMRESWYDLARFYYSQSQWSECLSAVETMMKIEHTTEHYLYDPVCYGPLAWDLLALASYNVGLQTGDSVLKQQAVSAGMTALSLSPSDDRLASNAEFYRKLI